MAGCGRLKYVCWGLLGYFLDVNVPDLIKMELPEEKAEDLFDRKVVELRRKGLSYPEISRCLNTSINVVKPIGEGLYALQLALEGRDLIEEKNRQRGRTRNIGHELR